MPREPALGLFRIAQEALRNVARHARASAVTVTLRAVNGGLQLAVQDNGVGFDVGSVRHGRSPSKKGSFGLHTMQERAQAMNGTVMIESQAGQGTAVTVCLPQENGGSA